MYRNPVFAGGGALLLLWLAWAIWRISETSDAGERLAMVIAAAVLIFGTVLGLAVIRPRITSPMRRGLLTVVALVAGFGLAFLLTVAALLAP